MISLSLSPLFCMHGVRSRSVRAKVGGKPYFRYDINAVPGPIILGAQGQGTCRALGRTLLDQNGIYFSLADKGTEWTSPAVWTTRQLGNRPNAFSSRKCLGFDIVAYFVVI